MAKDDKQGPDPTYRGFATRLRELRRQAEMSGAAAARIIGISQGALSRWEMGWPAAKSLDETLQGLDRFARHMGVSFEHLCFGRGDRARSSHPNRDAAAEFARACGYSPKAIDEALAHDTGGADMSAKQWFEMIEEAHFARLRRLP